MERRLPGETPQALWRRVAVLLKSTCCAALGFFHTSSDLVPRVAPSGFHHQTVPRQLYSFSSAIRQTARVRIPVGLADLYSSCSPCRIAYFTVFSSGDCGVRPLAPRVSVVSAAVQHHDSALRFSLPTSICFFAHRRCELIADVATWPSLLSASRLRSPFVVCAAVQLHDSALRFSLPTPTFAIRSIIGRGLTRATCRVFCLTLGSCVFPGTGLSSRCPNQPSTLLSTARLPHRTSFLFSDLVPHR